LGPLNSKYFFACVIHKKVNFDVIWSGTLLYQCPIKGVWWFLDVSALLPSLGSVSRAYWEMWSTEMQSIKCYAWACCV
jgi:hypothetical protein